MLNACIFASVAALVVGRIGFVLQHRDYFSQNPSDIISLTRATGYSASVALVAACFVGWFYLRRKPQVQFVWLVRVMAFVGVGASIGCINHGCGYGPEVWPDSLPLLWHISADLPDAYGVTNPRLPIQLMFAIWLLLGLILTRRHTRAFWLLLWLMVGHLAAISLGP